MEKQADKPQKEHAVFTFGRFNPPTTGHKKLVDKVVSHAKAHNADNYVFASHSQDSKKNPLGHKHKTELMKKFFPHAHVHDGEHVKTALDAVNHLHKKGYKKVTMLVGSDRHQEFHNLLHKYNPGIKHLEVTSAGHRDPDAEGVEGMSASKMRDHASKKEFSKFRHGVPNKAHAKELYHAVRKGMKLENFQNEFKALFLVGGPGSGKDFIINSLLDESKIIEFPLDKLYRAIADQTNLDELNNYPSMIINGNADNLNKILVSKQVLESMGYDVSMVYVYTTDEESKARNDLRISRGAKTFTEDQRKEKYESSIQNIHEFSPLFEAFHIFNNSDNFTSVNPTKKNEISGWLQELGESIGEFFEASVSSEAAKMWLMENGTKYPKAFLDRVNKRTSQIPHSGPMPAPNLKGFKRIKDGAFWKLVPIKEAEGIASSRSSSAAADTQDTPMRSLYQFGKKKSDSKSKSKSTKTATAPPQFFDQRMGAVPSGGVGLTSEFKPDGQIIQEKTFEVLRKNITSIISNIDGE